MSKFTTPQGIVTVKTLKDYITRLEESWTEDDIKYLGAVEDHPIMVEYPDGGVGFCQLYYDGGLGIMLLPRDLDGGEK